MALFKGHQLASYVASGTTENQGHSLFCCAGRGDPRKLAKTADANRDCAFVENPLYFTDPLEFTKKPGSPKIILTLFLAAATLSAAKNIVVIIFGPTGFFGLLTSFADFQHISCPILSEKFSCQISCQKAFV